MKKLLPSSSLLLALLCALPALRAQTAAPAAPAPSAAPAAAPAPNPAPEEKTALEKQMDVIGKSARALRKQIKDPAQNEASLALVAKIRAAAEIAVDLVPAKAQDLSGADKDKFIAAYQAGLKTFIGGVDALAVALKAGDNATAVKDLQQLYSLEKQDHKEFRKPEQH